MQQEIKEPLDELEYLIQAYIQKLDLYSFEQITKKPSDDQWSMGQMYVHLIRTSSNLYFQAIIECLNGAANYEAEKTAAGAEIFAGNGFPPVKIKVADSPTYTPNNPLSKDELQNGLKDVGEQAQILATRMDQENPTGKAQHGRLGAMSALEWLRLAGMHYRHHLRQQADLEQFISNLS